MIKRETDTDLFSSVIHHIIGQQISTKAQATIWQRMQKDLTEVNAETIVASLYLWAVAGGAIPEMKDHAPINNRKEKCNAGSGFFVFY